MLKTDSSSKKLPAPNVWLEPTTLRLRVSCSLMLDMLVLYNFNLIWWQKNQ